MRGVLQAAMAYDAFVGAFGLARVGRLRWRLVGDLAGDILEGRVGTGLNLRHYGPQARVTSIKPAVGLLRAAVPRARLRPRTGVRRNVAVPRRCLRHGRLAARLLLHPHAAAPVGPRRRHRGGRSPLVAAERWLPPRSRHVRPAGTGRLADRAARASRPRPLPPADRGARAVADRRCAVSPCDC